MTMTDNALADEIASTLRGLIYVPRLNPGSLVARREFWQRCHLLTPEFHHSNPPWIFVDGFEGACKWNSLKVYTDALEEGLSLWMGFACWGGSWAEHCWCMLGNRLVETTGPFRVYYGAELTSEERELLRERCGNFDLTAREHLHVITSDEWGRKHVKYDPAVYSKSIGRERDPKTGAIKPGLGH